MQKKLIYCSDRPWLNHYDPFVPPKINYQELTLPQLLQDSVKEFPGNTALIFQDFKMSYSNLWGNVEKFASRLTEFGIKKGDVVSILLPNMIPTVIAYYAIMRIGGVAVMCNPMYTDSELEYQFVDSGAKVLVTLDLLANRMIKLRSKTSIKQIIYTGFGDYLPAIKKQLFPLVAKKRGLKADVSVAEYVYRWKDCLRDSKSLPDVDISPDDPAVYQYTGGTTGVSKGVILSHRNLCAMAQMYATWFGVKRGEEIAMASPPIFHILGMSASMNLPLYMGFPVILIPKPQPEELLGAIRKYRPTMAALVPTMYIGMLQHPDLKKTDLTCFKLITSGGSSLPEDILHRFKVLTGAEINEGFGMTETSPSTHLNPMAGKKKPGSIGIPFSDTEVRIVDLETGTKDLPAGEAGEMLFRGPQVTGGYLNKPDETALAIRDGWLYSGDIAYMDDDGYFYIVDRKKDLIISGGYNVYPREIEEVFFHHPAVLKCAAIGIPDEKRGENVKVFAVLKDDARATVEELMTYCTERLAKYKWPAEIEIRDSLPESNVGKVLKKILREELRQRN